MNILLKARLRKTFRQILPYDETAARHWHRARRMQKHFLRPCSFPQRQSKLTDLRVFVPSLLKPHCNNTRGEGLSRQAARRAACGRLTSKCGLRALRPSLIVKLAIMTELGRISPFILCEHQLKKLHVRHVRRPLGLVPEYLVSTLGRGAGGGEGDAGGGAGGDGGGKDRRSLPPIQRPFTHKHVSEVQLETGQHPPIC